MKNTATTAAPEPGNATDTSKPHIRYEIEGLRFFAVFLVVIYHVWLGRVSGGVDIFLLVSAFLMTGQFDRKIQRGQSIHLFKHWLHLAKRLLPIAAVVIAATVIGSWLILPADRWLPLVREAWSSLFYFENWTLLAESADYYADHSAASPFQHFWSLSIQGQVFVIWPLIFFAVTWLARRLNLRPKRIFIVVFGAIFIVSLAYSIWQTETAQSSAYFNLFTRLWEFALGSLLALVSPLIRLPLKLRIALGWIGLAAIVSCGLVLNVERQFPGYLALWPTLAAAMVILAADTRNDARAVAPNRFPWLPGRGYGVDRLLAARPLVFMGGRSYGLYLWHWPLLVLALVATHRETLGPKSGGVLVGAAILLAILSTKFAERPLRAPKLDAKWYRSVVAVLAVIAVAAVPIGMWQRHINAQVAAVATSNAQNYPGALALDPGFEYHGSPNPALSPAAADLPRQFANLSQACRGQWKPENSTLAKSCQMYEPNKPITKTVLVLGDSHAEQWLPALQYSADAAGWRLVSVLKGGCPFSIAAPGFAPDCQEFNALAAQFAHEAAPDAVFMVGSVSAPSSAKETAQPGLKKTTDDLADSGIASLVIRDNPRFSFNMATCVMEKSPTDPHCNPARGSVQAATDPAKSVAGLDQRVHLLDLSDYLCTGTQCPGVIGNVFVYIDNNHLTKAYSETLGPALSRQIRQTTGWIGGN